MSGNNRIALMLPKLSTYGGAEGFAFRLADILTANGYPVDFICARQETAEPKGVNVVPVGRPPLGRAAKIAWYAYAAEQARKRGGYGLTISMGKTVRQDVLRMSGGPLSEFWRLSKRAYAQGFEREFKMLRRRLAPANRLIRHLERRALENQELCIAVSHRVQDWLLDAHPWLDKRQMKVIYNRPDLTRFTPASEDERTLIRSNMGLGAADQLIVLAGTNFALKGLGTLIRALALLPREVRVHVAGDRNPGRFKALAQSLAVQDRVAFLGRVDDMPSLYQASDLFCLPSFYDTCSNAVLEALASGTRVISSKDNGSSYFLPPDRIVDDSGDAQALALAIEQALNTPRPQGFQWPEDVESGLEPYLALAHDRLG
ncbi:glycosyltransferase family 4 protein [Desulfovibrio ferrophilus]|uniref:Glycosyl transferase group 1 n=1 Tax=Desulfovibrio ferrophilus TaxID=241368 RepID=A0A2Z6AUS8_9BACT|nr:glycosyltransferase family 4 protein [Desulfovibrio ferrophilus]BBD06970.1 glycosyl transferase group 1 [Desulfovibrio ferrophilus]